MMFLRKICVPTITVFILVFFISLNSFVTHASVQGVTAELDYTVGLDDNVDFVEPDDVFTANITVHGYTYVSPSIVPFDVMIAIDMSGSMEGDDPYDKRLDAAEAFLQRCASASPTPAGPIRAGIIGFRQQGRVEQDLTDDYTVFFGSDGVIDRMREQDLGRYTNIADAMAKAHYQLTTYGVNNTRVVILLTDGWPTPNVDEQEGMIDDQLIPEAVTKGFRYYTIGLGSNPYLDLREIAQLTGGFCIPEPTEPEVTAEDLNQIFTDIFEHASTNMTASQVTVKVRRDTGVASFVPGSLEVPPGIPDPTAGQLNTFGDEDEGWIDIVMGQLGNGDVATLSFRLKALECILVDDPEDMIEITPVRYPDSEITYMWGTQNPTFWLERKVISCRKRPYFDVEKEVDLDANKVTLTFTNNYPHRADVPDSARTFTNIRVLEQVSQYFQILYYRPRPYPFLPPIALDSNYIAPKRFIPGQKGGDFLYWEIPSLGPEEYRTTQFRIDSIAWAPRDAGKFLPVDMVDPKVTVPPVPEGAIKSRVYYDFDNQTQFVTIPDEPDEFVWFLPPILPDLNAEGGRPNLYVEPSLSLLEFKNLSPEPPDLSIDPQIPSSGPWPLPTNLFVRSESPNIWIDSATNGYVSNWLHRDGIDAYLENDSFHPLHPDRFGVTGQGDLFTINASNRIYIRVLEKGADVDLCNATAYILRHPPPGMMYVISPWDTLGNAVSVPVPPWAKYHLLYVEIPPGGIERGRHTRAFGTWGGVDFYTATVRINVVPAPNEAHYSNNVATERFLLVP